MHQNKCPYLSVYSKQQGMTLIEVLVAATILFSFLVVMTQAMSTAAIASEQAEKNIAVSLNIPFVVDQIENKLRKGKLSSNGKIKLNNINYEWIAEQHLQKVILQPPIQEQNIKRFTTLYQVDLTISKNSLHKSFHYMEIINEK